VEKKNYEKNFGATIARRRPRRRWYCSRSSRGTRNNESELGFHDAQKEKNISYKYIYIYIYNIYVWRGEAKTVTPAAPASATVTV